MNRLMQYEQRHTYGWLRDPDDERDYDFADIGDADIRILPSVNLSPYLHWRYQGATPLCVGFAIAHQIQIEERMNSVRGSLPSPRYIHAMARLQYQEKLRLTGTFPRMAYSAIKKLGCCPEEKFPFSTDETVLNTMPHYTAIKWAAGRRNLKYYRIKYNRLENIRVALSQGHPVTIGTSVTKHMRNYSGGDVVYRPKDGEEVGGGHYMCIVGYEYDYFLVANSWRSANMFYFAEDMITWDQSSDFYVITGWDDINA